MTLSNWWTEWRVDIAMVSAAILIATVVLFQEILLAPNQIALGEPEIDLPAQLWVLWWDNHPEREILSNAPFGDVNFYVLTPIHSWVAALLYPNVVLAHNLTTWLGLVSAMLGGALLGRRFGRSQMASMLGMVIVLGCAPLVAAFRDGTGEFIWVGILAMSIWFVDRVKSDGLIQDIIGLIVVSTMSILCSWYYGAAAMLLLAVMAICSPIHRWKIWLSMMLSLVCASVWIHQFTESDFESRPVKESLWEQLQYGGTGPVADAGMQTLPWISRTQLSLMDSWWLDPWLWGLVLLVWSGHRHATDRGIWFAITILSFVVGFGSVAPDGWALPMLYGNRLLEWFGVGMHLPFHISTIGLLALLVMAVQATKPVMTFSFILMTGNALWTLHNTVRWPVERYPEMSNLKGPVLHIGELAKPTQAVLNEVMILQLSHQQSIVSFPIFPTVLQKTEGIHHIRSQVVQGITAERLQSGGIRTLISPIHQPVQSLEQCCLAFATAEWKVYTIDDVQVK